MPALTITAANSVYMLSIAGLFDQPQRLQGYAADAAFSTESVETVETVLGVDGNLSAGWLPVAYTQTMQIMPDSLSSLIFEEWHNAQQSAREVFSANATILLPATGRQYTLTRGFLKGYVPIPEAAKTLRARSFSIIWASIAGAPTG